MAERVYPFQYQYSFTSAVGVRGHHCFETEWWCSRPDVLDWCAEQFGSEGRRWAYSRDGSTIYIQDDNDAFAFRLRWC